MEIDLGNLYEKDEDENYKYENAIRAFEAFAMTDVGTKWIKSRAQEGFKLEGAFEKDLNINIEKEGSLSKKGIDYNFTVEEVDNIEEVQNAIESGMISSGAADGHTDATIENGRREEHNNS